MWDSVRVLAWSIVAVLAVLLVGAVVTAVVLAQRLADVRRVLAAFEAATVAQSPRIANRAAQTAGLAVRTVLDSATRLRERGVREFLLSSIEDLTTWALENRREITRIAAPDGTVTILFSDIENSTALNSEIGDDRWVRLLAAHDRLLCTYIDKHRGHVVKSQGDGYMVVFSTPDLALQAALDIQRALGAKWQQDRRLRRTPLRVRIGMHTGPAIEKEGDWFGGTVAKAARVAAVAGGGEIVVSDEVATALEDEPGVEFTEVGSVALKGLPGQHVLWLATAASDRG